MDLVKLLRSQGFDVEGATGDYLFPEKYVENDPKKPKIEFIDMHLTEEDTASRKAYEINALRKRYDNFVNGVNLWENVQRVDINLMTAPPSNWSYRPRPKKHQLLALTGSIEAIGLIQPIILYREPSTEKFTILDGVTRVMALEKLNSIDPSEKYQFPVCIILDCDTVDEYYLRTLIHDLNFSYREVPQEILIKMVLERYELLKRCKQQFRSEFNIAEQLAEEFLMSTSTVFNYLVLKKLTEEVLTLLYEKRISLQVARCFARVSHEAQLTILNNIDFKNINNYHRIKYITGYDGNDLKEIKSRVENSKNLVPDKIKFTVEIHKKLLSKASENFIDLKKYAVTKLASVFKKDNIDQYCKIRFDKSFMGDYVSKELLDENSLKKLEAKKIADLYLKVSI